MKDSEHQDQSAIAFPASDLTRRLLRRATAPIGMIDVRHAEALHSRSSWMGERSAFLESLKSRYGSGEDASGVAGIASHETSGGPFVARLRAIAANATSSLGAMPSSTGRTGTSDGAVGEVSSASSAVSAQQYRVKRPGHYADLGPAKSFETGASQSPAARLMTTSFAAPDIQRARGEMQPFGGNAPDAPAPLPQDDTLASRRDDSFAPLRQVSELQRTASAAEMPLHHASEDLAGGEIGRTPTRNAGSGNDAPALSPPSVPDAPALLQRAADGHSEDAPASRRDGSLAPLPQVSEMQRTASAAEMPLRRISDGLAGGEMGRTSVRDALLGRDAPALSGPPPARVQPAADAPALLQRAADGHSGDALASKRDGALGTLPQVNEMQRTASAVEMPLRYTSEGLAGGEIGDGGALASKRDGSLAPLPQVSELQRTASAVEMPLRHAPEGVAGGEIGDGGALSSKRDGSLAPLPQVSEMQRTVSAVEMPLRHAPEDVAGSEIGRSDAPALSGPPPARVQHAPDAPALLQRAADGHSGDTLASRRDGSLAPLPQVSELQRMASAAEMPLRHAPEGLAGGEIGGTSTQDAWSGSDAPVSSSLSTGLHLQRKTDHPAMVPAAAAMPIAETAATRSHRPSAHAVSAEIRNAPASAAASIVWRKAANGSANGPATTAAPAVTHAGGTQLMRQPESQAISSGSAVPVEVSTPKKNDIDVVLVAEQVGRMISRQLRIERERRGRRR